MSGEPENPVLVYLRRIDADLTELKADMADVKRRLTAVEIQIGGMAVAEQNHYSSLATRLDRAGKR